MFFVLDTNNIKHQLRIKESLYMTMLKPILNKLKQCQYITLFLTSFSFVSSLFFVTDSFDFAVWVLYLIVTFNWFLIWKLHYIDHYVNLLAFLNTVTFLRDITIRAFTVFIMLLVTEGEVCILWKMFCKIKVLSLKVKN